MWRGFTNRISVFVREALGAVRGRVRALIRPRSSVVLGFAADMCRSREELMSENALLRQQLIVAQRHVKRPKLRSYERAILQTYDVWFRPVFAFFMGGLHHDYRRAALR